MKYQTAKFADGMFNITCPHCSNEVAVDETQLGQINAQMGGHYPCPIGNCGQEIHFPNAEEAEALKTGGAAPAAGEAPQPAPAPAPTAAAPAPTAAAPAPPPQSNPAAKPTQPPAKPQEVPAAEPKPEAAPSTAAWRLIGSIARNGRFLPERSVNPPSGKSASACWRWEWGRYPFKAGQRH